MNHCFSMNFVNHAFYINRLPSEAGCIGMHSNLASVK